MMYINIIMATIFGLVALYAAFRTFKPRPAPTTPEEMALRKEQHRRRRFILIFSASLALTAGLWDVIVSGNFGFGWGIIAIVMFIIVAFVYAFEKISMASVLAVVAVFTILFAPSIPQLVHQPVEASTAFVYTVAMEAPEDSATPAPLTGAATVTEDAPATIKCGIQDDGSFIALKSWSELVSCIENSPESERDAYIAAANDRSDLDLSWSSIKAYAEREKAEGIDSRSILALNVGDMTDEEIRAGATEAAGEAAATLPIVRKNGPLVNSGNFHTAAHSGIGNFEDNRRQIRVQLNPIQAPTVQTVAAPNSMKLSSYTVDYNAKGGVLVECANFTGGTPPTTPPKPPKPTPPPTTPPTPTPTPTPSCTPGPEKCAEDDRLNEDPVNEAPEPPGDKETEEPVEEDPAGTPSEDPPTSEVPDHPADGVDEGTGETPREEVPEVPADVPADENETPLEGDQDPDSGTSTQDTAPAAPEVVQEAPAPDPAQEAPATPEEPVIEAPAEEAPPSMAPEDAASLGLLIPAVGVGAMLTKLKGRRLFK